MLNLPADRKRIESSTFQDLTDSLEDTDSPKPLPTSSQYLSSKPSLSGYLFKRKSTTKVFRSSVWVRRWFTLTDNKINYSSISSKGKREIISTIPINVGQFRLKRIYDEKRTDGRLLCFEISNNSQSYVLQGIKDKVNNIIF